MNFFKITFILSLLMISKSYTQSKATVEKSIFGVETGFLGFWINNEFKLASSISLKSELGIDAGLFGGGTNKIGTVLVPVLTLEPRYYYNLQKRRNNNKTTRNNSANFLALNLKFQSDISITSNKEIDVVSNINVIPKWSLRRTIGDHFHYETGFGIGYRYFLEKVNSNTGEIAVDLHLRVGYNF